MSSKGTTKVGKGTTKGTKATTKGKEVIGHDTNDNPYRPGGSYHAVVECCRKLGASKMHPFAALLKAFPSVMGADNFKAFKAKDARNENGKDAEGRILQNFLVVNRPDYGLPLRRCGFEVRKMRDEKGYSFGLFKIGEKETKAAQKAEIVRTPKAAPAPVKVVKATTKTKATTKGKATKATAAQTAPKAVKKTTKKASKGKAKTTVNAGGGILVDVVG